MLDQASSVLLSHLQLPFEPVADPAATVRGAQVRFTALTSRLIRIEHSPDEQFEDRASQVFWYRRQPVPAFEVTRDRDRIEIATEHLHLCYSANSAGFTRRSLSIELRASGVIWHYGDRDTVNLQGTARTLDGAGGDVRLERGLMSRAGWSVVDDSRALVFDDSGWLAPRRPGIDLYFFGYGHDYVQCLKDYCQVAGPAPLVPRFVLGNWWSRYWEYTQAELLQLMAEFRRHDVPLSVCIVDMDWHLTRTGNASSGWTGYTWNRDLFPDPEGFIAQLHALGLKTALNLHPAEGVHSHEAAYASMARALGIDPAAGDPIAFDIAERRFAEAYFDVLHHPLEAQGVDFWWVDWQQGQDTRLPGLDPLWWLNHLHFYDLGRDGEKRPFVFSRWGGLGNHRYPIGFSGDTVVAWAALSFQPRFTATAANVSYGWWSHDIGGHMGGVEDAELYTRWVQFGVFSPILRLHSTKNAYHERRPWGFDAEALRIARAAMQLRHALIPYLYTMAWRDHAESNPLVTPMYYLLPEREEAYHCPDQYAFGSELIAAPCTSPRDADTGLSRQTVWLPPGDWFDFFSGEHFRGDRWRTIYGALDDIPVFAKAGAIVPLGPMTGWGGIDAPGALSVHVFPGADNRFELYEDDGATTAYRRGHYALTPFSLAWHGDRLHFKIESIRGDRSLAPAQRSYTLIFKGVAQPDTVEVRIDGVVQQLCQAYDALTETFSLESIALGAASELAVTLTATSGSLMAKRDRRLAICRKLLRAFRLDTDLKGRIDSELPEIIVDTRLLTRYGSALKDAHLAALTQIIDRGDRR